MVFSIKFCHNMSVAYSHHWPAMQFVASVTNFANVVQAMAQVLKNALNALILNTTIDALVNVRWKCMVINCVKSVIHVIKHALMAAMDPRPMNAKIVLYHIEIKPKNIPNMKLM